MKNSSVAVCVSFLIGAAGLAANAGAIDVNTAILPGWGQYYWNVRSTSYIHPPAFDFKTVAGAASYRFTVSVDGRTNAVFTAATPKANLSPAWPKLPKMGIVRLVVEGLAADGRVLGDAGTADFWKNAPFEPGAYPPAARPYGEAAKRCYDYLFSLPAMKNLAATGKPDFAGNTHFCYPSKMYSSIINAAVNFAAKDPSRRDEMLRVARASADYLLATAEAADAPLGSFPQTYEKGVDLGSAKVYAGQIMTCYPADAGAALLRLAGATGERKYREAAVRIAATYLKLQGADGTWYLKLWAKDGTPVTKNRLFPLGVCSFLVALAEETKDPQYRAAADRAFAFIENRPLADWNWEGQFEDVAPSARYQNLTKHPAVSTAMYLLKRYPGDPERRRKARELMAFAEDQFVMWEKPTLSDGVDFPNDKNRKNRIRVWPQYPTVFEQYNWYVPVDASVAKLIRGYLALYAAEKDPLDLAKAKALGDSLTRAQLENGRIPTEWMHAKPMNPKSDWWNCMFASAGALEQLAESD